MAVSEQLSMQILFWRLHVILPEQRKRSIGEDVQTLVDRQRSPTRRAIAAATDVSVVVVRIGKYVPLLRGRIE